MTYALLHDIELINETPDGNHVNRPPHWSNNSFSTRNHEVLENTLYRSRNSGEVVMEIGVDRDYPSSTSTILANLRGRKYLGVDIADKSHLDDKGIHTLMCSSMDSWKVLLTLSRMVNGTFNWPLSLLHIDGCHRTDHVLNDWGYASLVDIGGFVVIHDTRVFRGPRELVKAIDPRYFEVAWHCDEDPTDWGIATARRVR